jgi:ABC-type branched-subunit amino acid transport system substrate-binding protein
MQSARCTMQSLVPRFLRLAPCLLLLFASCLLLPACLPGVVRPAVKIGLVAPFEGRYRYVGYDVIYAVRLALREANAAGGVGGYSVELVAFDDGAEPAMAVEQARKLAADPEVVAAIGHFRDETTAVALSIYSEAGIPLIAPAVLDPALTGGAPCHDCQEAEVYRLGPPVDALASALLHELRGSGQFQVALVTEGGPLGAALQQDVARLVTAADAPQVWPVVSPDDAGWLREVRASGAEVVFCDAAPVIAGEVVSALRADGWEGDFLGGPELAAPDFVAVAGQAAEGTLFVTPWPFAADVPGGAETRFFPRDPVSGETTDFIAAYRTVSNGVPPGPLAFAAYEATWVLLGALERDITAHGVPMRGGIGAMLEATRHEGLLGRVTFDAGRSWSDAPLYWYRVGVGGEAVLELE